VPTNRKLLSFERLLAVRQEARAGGKSLVQCHGCFDIVHPGHVAYLQFAKSQGDVLLVSLTADSHVNKGLNRPLIPDDLRAASLAALECVDYVHVNPDPTAVELLERVRPDVYVKGREYENNQDPRFLAERDAVIRSGGRVVFSSGDVVYSSSALINTMPHPEVFADEKTRRFRQQYDLSGTTLLNLIMRFRSKRIVVVGDYVLDRYTFCDATSVASEAPMMSLRQLKSEDYDGGAGIVALHLAALGARPTLLTALAEDEASARLESRLTEAGVAVQAMRTRRELVSKQRYLVDQQKLFKIDRGAAAPLDSRNEQILADRILSAAAGADGVIFVDFGYGLIGGPLLDRVMPELRHRAGVITADVSGMQSNLLRFKNVDLLCPTEREVRQTINDFSSGLTAVACHLLSVTGARQALITLGKQGLVAFDNFLPPVHGQSQSWERRVRSEYLPPLASHAVDPLGCGDALLSAASLALVAGGSLQAAAYVGSLAAAIEAQHVGNRPVSADDLLSRIAAAPRRVESPEAQRLAS
jgi:rfaE bifunctional protein kinase chain/domain/rfaE bifunctional protein nucleotidyltransferase chain/domain